MLNLYRRHIKGCRFWTGKGTNGNRLNNNCRCPIWVDGYRKGVRVRRTLGIRDWSRAIEIVRDWEISGSVGEQACRRMPVREACDSFIADVAARVLSEAGLKKYMALLVDQRKPGTRGKLSLSLVEFCAESGIEFTGEILPHQITLFCSQWKKDSVLSSRKKLERLRAFGRFLADRGWWKENYALKLTRSRATGTIAFTNGRE
jgi:hypothetical protein